MLIVFAHHYCVSRFFFSCLRHGMSYDLKNSIMMRDVVYAFRVKFISFSHDAYIISRIIMPLLRSYHESCRKLIAPFTLTVLERTLSWPNGLVSINWNYVGDYFFQIPMKLQLYRLHLLLHCTAMCMEELLNKRWRARLRLNTKELGMWRM